MLDVSYQGKEFDPYVFEVERGKIKELALAIGDDNPLFFDAKYAQEKGYKDVPAPLTFATVMNFWGYPEIWDKMIMVGIDIKKLLHAKEEYEYFAPIYPGDKISGTVSIESMRASTKMDMVTFKTTYKRDNEVVTVAKMSIIIGK